MIMIRHGAISQVAAYFYLVPPVTAIMAWALFDERLTPVQLIGMALACFAVMMAVQKAGPTVASLSRRNH
jgi:drug/metabolite transporter (DMT)-like permease